MFVIKIHKKLYWPTIKAISVLLIFSVTTLTQAHEMWIQPVNYSVEAGKGILADEIVGQGFKGNKYAYIDRSFEKLNITVGNKTQAVKSRLGDLPAIQELTADEGLHIITAETPYSVLNYETAKKFANFLNADGLQWVFEEHKKRGLPDKGFKEVYRRNPKTLVKVGHGKGQDRALGMPLEWVVETNPYTSSGIIKAKLLWQGKAAANMYVNIFNKPKFDSPDSALIKTSLTTDEEGRIEIPRADGGLFLINSVKMIKPNAKIIQSTGAVWESIWASLTYEILNKI